MQIKIKISFVAAMLMQLPVATWAQVYQPSLGLYIKATNNSTSSKDAHGAASTAGPSNTTFALVASTALSAPSASSAFPSSVLPFFAPAASSGNATMPSLALPTSTPTVLSATAYKTVNPFVGPVQRKKWSAPAASICQSPEFELTVENWRESRASEFLKRWVYDFSGDMEYAKKGVLGSLAFAFLGRSDLKCSIGFSHSCMISCNEIVSLVSSPEEARALWFVMTAGRHYLEVMEVADRGLLAAQVNVGQWTDTMALKFFWTQETSHDRVFKMTVTLLSSFFAFFMFTAMPLIPFDTLERTIQSQIKTLDAKVRTGLSPQEQVELLEQKKVLDAQLESAKTKTKWGTVGFNAIGNGIPMLSIPAMEFMTWEGYEKAHVMNVAELGLAISELVSSTRLKNQQSVEETMSGRLHREDGSTMLGAILESGSFLATDAQMLGQWTGPMVEKRLTDALKYRIFSEALKSQGVYIQCTQKVNAFTCENDDSGPQNLKACIDNHVCYMYKWSGRGYSWRHHVEEPFGVDNMGDWPFVVTPEEIITSSFRTYREQKAGHVGGLLTDSELITPQNFMDASTPGAFFLPVCVNNQFSQNTPLDNYGLLDDFNPWSDKKTLPCSCGEFWSDETEKVWRDTGLATAKSAQKYRATFCPRQLKDKMPNKLERFVADCRLGISTGGLFDTYRAGRHQFCDVVLPIIERHGRSPDSIDAYLRVALECKIGLHTTSIRNKPKKECAPYMRTGFEELMSRNNPKAQEWGLSN